MINTSETHLGQSILWTELYDYLELRKGDYSRYTKRELVENPYFERGKDYFAIVQSNNSKGQIRQDYYVHIDTAKKLCMVSKSKKGNEIRNELVQLTKNVENALLVSREQIKQITQMIKIFSIYEYRKKALLLHQGKYVENALINNPSLKDSNFVYAQFHSWRNEVLNLGKDVLAQRVKEHCIIEQKKIPNKFTQDQALVMMGDYEMIKNSIWDLLCSQGKSDEMIKNICLIASDLANEMKPYLQRLNESDLFFKKIDENEIKAIGV